MYLEGLVKLVAIKAEKAPEYTDISEISDQVDAPVAAYFCAEAQSIFLYTDPAIDVEKLQALWASRVDHSHDHDTFDLTLAVSETGPAAGISAPYHYVVWTDVEAGWEEELDAWYAREHLSGLASVPGTIAARRYLCASGGPRSFACYDLVSPDVMGSPAWLAVRGTAWSSRVRPHFTNTRRMMFRKIFDNRLCSTIGCEENNQDREHPIMGNPE